MSTMSLRNIFRAPFSIGLAVCALAAAVIKKSAGKTAKSVAAPPQSGPTPAKNAEERTEELTRLSHRLLTAGEEEKARIARNLHDGLGSTLTAVNLDLFWVQQRLADQPALASRLARAIEVLASTVEMKRGIIHSLRPAALDNLGLSLAIESHIAEFEKTCAVPIEMDLSAELPPLTSHAFSSVQYCAPSAGFVSDTFGTNQRRSPFTICSASSELLDKRNCVQL